MKNDKLKEDVETLDFENKTTLQDDEIETLDFDTDAMVSNQIDEMLDFIEITDNKTDEINEELDDLLKNKKAIKDFNIKSAKTRKIVKKVMLYVIIVMLLGFEFFINKSGEALNNLRVYASDNEPIRIVQNEKYGYIDFTGEKIVNPKYTYAENFVKGYAIVKNSSNLPLIIDKGGKEKAPTGTYFSLYRANDDIIASKITKGGLKYGILDSGLKVKTSFKYDSIVYKEGVYTYVKDME